MSKELQFTDEEIEEMNTYNGNKPDAICELMYWLRTHLFTNLCIRIGIGWRMIGPDSHQIYIELPLPNNNIRRTINVTTTELELFKGGIKNYPIIYTIGEEFKCALRKHWGMNNIGDNQ